MKRFTLLCCILCFPLLLNASDNPSEELEAQAYSAADCIQKKADQCITSTCTAGPASEDPNCNDNCQSIAKAECDSSR
jgi:hypothetical protein